MWTLRYPLLVACLLLGQSAGCQWQPVDLETHLGTARLRDTHHPRRAIEGDGHERQPPGSQRDEASVEASLQTLKEMGVRFRHAPVPPTTTRRGAACAVEDAIRIVRGGTGIRFSRPVRANVAFAVRLARFERIVQEEAQRWFGRRVRRIEHLGSYVCRHIASGSGRLSEHGAANALDVAAFVLEGGRRVSIKRDYVLVGQTATRPAQQFVSALVERLRDEQVFSTILTPDWDRRHHNHLHLDGRDRHWMWQFWSS